jgi:dihydroflavonol-4-reductase
VDTGLNVVHARDVAEGHLLAAARGRVGERYILGHRNMTLAEILAEVGAILGRPAPRLRLPYAAALAVGALDTALSRFTHRPPTVALEAVRMARRRMFFDAGKAVRELGLPQTPVRRAFEDAIAWFAERGYLAGAGQGRTAWASR